MTFLDVINLRMQILQLCPVNILIREALPLTTTAPVTPFNLLTLWHLKQIIDHSESWWNNWEPSFRLLWRGGVHLGLMGTVHGGGLTSLLKSEKWSFYWDISLWSKTKKKKEKNINFYLFTADNITKINYKTSKKNWVFLKYYVKQTPLFLKVTEFIYYMLIKFMRTKETVTNFAISKSILIKREFSKLTSNVC